MKAFIRKYAARLAGVIVGGLTGLLVNWGVNIAPEALAGLQNFLTELIAVGTLAGYSAVHVWIEHRKEENGG